MRSLAAAGSRHRSVDKRLDDAAISTSAQLSFTGPREFAARDCAVDAALGGCSYAAIAWRADAGVDLILRVTVAGLLGGLVIPNGLILPLALGPSPSATITAMAHRAADQLIAEAD